MIESTTGHASAEAQRALDEMLQQAREKREARRKRAMEEQQRILVCREAKLRRRMPNFDPKREMTPRPTGEALEERRQERQQESRKKRHRRQARAAHQIQTRRQVGRALRRQHQQPRRPKHRRPLRRRA